MSQRFLLTSIFLLGGGFGLGFALRKGSTSDAGSPVSLQATAANSSRDFRKETAAPALAVPRLKSGDTLETLRDYDAPGFFSRAALWMNGASAEDLQRFWDGMKSDPGERTDLLELLMLHWTRLDPQAAMAAAEQSWYPTIAWETWAANDPAAALAAARRDNTLKVTYVAWGIGKFHPGWLRDHLAEIPAPGLDNAFTGLAEWSRSSDPAGEIQLLWENGHGFSQETFRHLIQDDPMEAYAWIRDHGMPPFAFKGGAGGAMGEIADALAETRPEKLQQLIASQPEGEIRRQMEGAAFRELLSRDPAAALEQAKQTAAPRVAAEQLAMAGKALAETDPDAAFDAMNRVLTAYPAALMPIRMLGTTSEGSDSMTPPVAGSQELTRALLKQDPARLLELPVMQDAKGGQSLDIIAGQWANADLDAFSTWAIAQADAPNGSAALGVAVNSLTRAGRIDDAANAAQASAEAGLLNEVFQSWMRSDAAAAGRWLDQANLPDSRKDSLRNSGAH